MNTDSFINEKHNVKGNFKSSIKITKPKTETSEGFKSANIINYILPEKQKKSRSKINLNNLIHDQINHSSDMNRNDEKCQKETTYSLSQKFKEMFTFKVFEDVLYVWDEKRRYYIPLSNENADVFFRKYSPERLKFYINSRNIKEIVSWIRAECDINLTSVDLIEKNRNLVIFNDGIYNTENSKFLNLNPDYNIRSKINADFRTLSTQGKTFEKFMDDICQNDERIYNRIQEFFGYIISEIRDLKIIIFLIGPKDSGKSIVLKLLDYLIGEDFCTSLSLEELNQKEYLNRLLSKKLNTCGEVSEISIKRLDNLKKLSGGDKIMSKALYDQPVSFVNRAALVFAGNHLPDINNLDKSNAFSERLLIIPFLNQIPKDKQDPTLFNKLLNEINYIAQWALKGLLRLIENNYNFTENQHVTKIIDNYKLESNSIEHFIKNSCIMNHDCKIFKDAFENAYYQFCEENNVVASNRPELHKYLKASPYVTFKRIRIGTESKNGYVGIQLKLKSEVT